jgi:S-adenosyl-L-methionine hydrolase (adenosine-forming)
MGLRPIVFLTDYGLEDEFVGLCHGVIARISPGTTVIDLAHGIPPQDVVRGAIVLRQSVQFMPDGAVYLAVVDPGVGTSRRTLAIRTRSDAFLVGPDNGLLSLAWEELGGAEAVAEISSPKVIRTPVSTTFHGRDVFAPAAAHLSMGITLEDLGPAVDPTELVVVGLPEAVATDGRLACPVLSIDRFGNIQLAARPEHLEAAGLGKAPRLEVRASSVPVVATRARTFDDVGTGDFGLIEDSGGWLAVVLTQGNAADGLGLRLGEVVIIAEPGG